MRFLMLISVGLVIAVSADAQAQRKEVRHSGGMLAGYTETRGGKLLGFDVSGRVIGAFEHSRNITVNDAGTIECQGNCLETLIWQRWGQVRAMRESIETRRQEGRPPSYDEQDVAATNGDRDLAQRALETIAMRPGRHSATWSNPATGHYGSWAVEGAPTDWGEPLGHCRENVRMVLTTPGTVMARNGSDTDTQLWTVCFNASARRWTNLNGRRSE